MVTVLEGIHGLSFLKINILLSFNNSQSVVRSHTLPCICYPYCAVNTLNG